MATILELAQLSKAVYDTPPSAPSGWTLASFRSAAAGGMSEGLQGAVFTRGSETVIAFRGTNTAQDVLPDLQLGVGMNTNYYSAAQEFAAAYSGASDVSLTGHSLGGAIAQVVGNRGQFKFATFNAPGVAVIATSNPSELIGPLAAVRVVGSIGTAILHPIQAAQDVRATFRSVTGVNVCLQWDQVSRVGAHYGKVVRIPGTGRSPLEQHYISTVITVLEDRSNPTGALTIDSLA